MTEYRPKGFLTIQEIIASAVTYPWQYAQFNQQVSPDNALL